MKDKGLSHRGLIDKFVTAIRKSVEDPRDMYLVFAMALPTPDGDVMLSATTVEVSDVNDAADYACRNVEHKELAEQIRGRDTTRSIFLIGGVRYDLKPEQRVALDKRFVDQLLVTDLAAYADSNYKASQPQFS